MRSATGPRRVSWNAATRRSSPFRRVRGPLGATLAELSDEQRAGVPRYLEAAEAAYRGALDGTDPPPMA